MASRLKRNKRVIGETLAELDANAGHLSETSRATDVPVSTIWFWRENYSSDPEVERYKKIKNEELAQGFRVIAVRAIERLNREIDQVSTDKLATVAAISTDKQLLLTGKATSITSKAKDEQLDSARLSYILAALPDLQQLHPDWSEIDLKQAAEQGFTQWIESLNLTPLASDMSQ